MDWWIEALRLVRALRDRTDRDRTEPKELVNSIDATPAPREVGNPRPPRIQPIGPARANAQPRSAADTAPGATQRGRQAARVTAANEAVDPFPFDRIDPHAVSTIRRLERFGHKAYLVGGCVRDLLLDLPPKDFDIATNAHPEEVRSIFRNSRVIGRRFRLVHLYFRGGKIIEVSTFRASAVPDEDADDLLIRRDNIYGTEEEDALRRDFTINGLFYDVDRRRIIDHVGGLDDVRNRRLRMIGDPEIRLREDPVRILRAIRFLAKTNLDIDPDLAAAIPKYRDQIARCAPARVLEETLRLLRMGCAERTVDLLEETGVLEILLPEVHRYIVRDPTGERRNASQRHLRALDEMVRREPVSDAVAIGALLYAPIVGLEEEARREGLDPGRTMLDFLDAVTRPTTMTKRMSEVLRRAFAAQRYFGPPSEDRARRARGGSRGLGRREAFAEASRLYELHALASGVPAENASEHATREPPQRRGGRGRGKAPQVREPSGDASPTQASTPPTAATSTDETSDQGTPRQSRSRRRRRRGPR